MYVQRTQCQQSPVERRITHIVRPVGVGSVLRSVGRSARVPWAGRHSRAEIAAARLVTQRSLAFRAVGLVIGTEQYKTVLTSSVVERSAVSVCRKRSCRSALAVRKKSTSVC